MALDVKTGTDWEFSCRIIDQAQARVDVRSATATCLLKAAKEDADADALAELDVDLSAGEDGSVTMTLAKAYTAEIAAGDYWVGLRLLVSGFEAEPVEFMVRVEQAVVRAM